MAHSPFALGLMISLHSSYVNLALILLFRDISVPVKKRFPTLLHVVSAGMMTSAEMTIIEESQSKHRNYWIPIIWAMNLVHRARVDKRIADHLYAEALLAVDDLMASEHTVGPNCMRSTHSIDRQRPLYRE